MTLDERSDYLSAYMKLFSWIGKHHHLYTDSIELALDALAVTKVEGELAQIAWDLADSFIEIEKFAATQEKWKE